MIDKQYLHTEAQKMDGAWCAFHAGYISRSHKPGRDVWQNEKFPVIDEYRFIRKNYSYLWSIYVLVLRIITFNNPLKECQGWWNTRHVKRVNFTANANDYSDYKVYKSNLLSHEPTVSIIIPTLNRYIYLRDGLNDLEQQTYKNFEVIIVDQSEPFQEEFYKDWNFPLRFWHQSEKALWKARNDAIQVAKGEFILLFDDDSRVEANWIEHHIKAMDFFEADISSGVSISQVGDKVPAHYAYFRWSDQLDTGNVLIRRNVFERIGLFDRQFEKQRMGDGEFGLRAYLAGFRNISNPYAKRLHLKVGEGGLRQMGSWDGWRPKKLFAPRPVPSVLYLYRRYFGRKATILIILSSIIPSVIPYQFKQNKALIAIIAFLFPIVFPFLLIQVLISWRASIRKIKQGPLISALHL